MPHKDHHAEPARCPRTGHPIPPAAHRRLILMLRLGGLASLLWFLVRVIPKPSRAMYPCQRAAAPLAAGFVVWALGAVGALTAWRSAGRCLRRGRTWAAALLTLAAVAAGALCFVSLDEGPVRAANRPPLKGAPGFVPADPPNQPIGLPFGIKPGRVAWDYDPAAVSWDGSGHWWEDRFTSQAEVERMLARVVCAVAGTADPAAAWGALFRDFNARHGHPAAGYARGEKIAIKINLNQSPTSHGTCDGSYTSPHFVLALLRQLVRQAGVDPADIIVYDATRCIPSTIFDRCAREFPGVNFVDWTGGDGREIYVRDLKAQVHWSAPLTLDPRGGNPAYLPTCVTGAAYLIDIAHLRGHFLAGVSLSAKNHLGSICADLEGRPSRGSAVGAGLHPYIAAHPVPWITDEGRTPGTYTPLVDLMGHKDLGGKTVLYLIDGLYATKHNDYALDMACRWKSAPFNGGWTASIFAAQDPVALDSVGVDFLRSEPTLDQVYGCVDNYLHEAALADRSPSKTLYDPEGDGIPMRSQGVHEHWNNGAEKKYTRNLGSGQGIELVVCK
ncbi:MAG: DUF362 domain-containing protein [bacterium]|nr:DUF362 domain-containing protein [bacterium]